MDCSRCCSVPTFATTTHGSVDLTNPDIPDDRIVLHKDTVHVIRRSFSGAALPISARRYATTATTLDLRLTILSTVILLISLKCAECAERRGAPSAS
jgi:hypothetical protein